MLGLTARAWWTPPDLLLLLGRRDDALCVVCHHVAAGWFLPSRRCWIIYQPRRTARTLELERRIWFIISSTRLCVFVDFFKYFFFLSILFRFRFLSSSCVYSFFYLCLSLSLCFLFCLILTTKLNYSSCADLYIGTFSVIISYFLLQCINICVCCPFCCCCCFVCICWCCCFAHFMADLWHIRSETFAHSCKILK